jgi:hypothetical protein
VAVLPSVFFVVIIGDAVGAAWLNIGCGTAIGAPSEFKLVGSAFGNPRLAIAAIHSCRWVAHAPTIFAGQPGPVWSQLPGVKPFVALVSTFPFKVCPILFFLF